MTGSQATFTTSGPYVNLPSGLFGSYAAVSVEAWVTTGVNTMYARVFQFGASGTSNANSILVYRDSTAATFSLQWFTSGSYQSFFVSTVSFDSKANVHLVVTVSAGDYARLYINGVLLGNTPDVVNPIPPPTTFYIGKSFDGEPGLIGSVNEFRIWAGVLSATDITTRYSQGPGAPSCDFATLIDSSGMLFLTITAAVTCLNIS